MKETTVRYLRRPKLKTPVLIEGLPGIGLVGKLAAEYLVDSLKARKFVEIYSPHFPHQVIIRDDGTIKMIRNELYYWKAKKEGQKDLIILVGDVQAITPEAQYELAGTILDIFEEFGGRDIITLGGYGTGEYVEKPRVFGAATTRSLKRIYGKYGVLFGEVGGSIVGAAGLLIGLGALRGMRGICLMGETHGRFIDANAAKAVLEVVTKVLKLEIDMSEMEQRAKEAEKTMKTLLELQEESEKMLKKILGKKEERLTYIR